MIELFIQILKHSNIETFKYRKLDLNILRTPAIPYIKIERESKPRKNEKSVFTMKFSPDPKGENKTYS